MLYRIRSCFASVLLLAFCLLFLPAKTVFALEREVPAVVAAPQPDDWWRLRHEQVLSRVRQGAVDFLMIGDSITQGWGGEGRPVWDLSLIHI